MSLSEADSLMAQKEKFLYFSTKILGCRKSILQQMDKHSFLSFQTMKLNCRECEVRSNPRARKVWRKPIQKPKQYYSDLQLLKNISYLIQDFF